MPYRVPDNRPNDRVEKGEQPYTDDRETMSQQEAKLEDQALDNNGQEQDSDEKRRARLETDAEESFEDVQKKRSNRQ